MDRVHTFSDLEGVRIAIEMERRGAEHYRRAARIVKRAEIVELLKELTRDEERHIEEFTDLYDLVANMKGADQPYDEVASAYLSAIASDIVFPSGITSLLGDMKSVDTILEHGIKSEKDSIDFYGKMCEATRDDNAREVFSEIIEQERGHLSRLEDMLRRAHE